MDSPNPSKLIIDLGAIVRNWRYLASTSKTAACAAVVKADAYGAGIDRVVPTLYAAGCRIFFVAVPEEATRVRAAAPDATVYLLCGLMEGGAAFLSHYNIRPCLNSFPEIEEWAQWCELNYAPPCALHVDTGINRTGLDGQELEKLRSRSELISAIHANLLMSHFACADDPDHPLNGEQEKRFDEVRHLFPGIAASFANSAAVISRPQSHFDLLRPGISIYGGNTLQDRPNTLEPVATVLSRVLQVRHVKKGEAVGYGCAETVKRDSRVAVLSSGYADGYHRGAGSNNEEPGARVCFDGHIAPIIGRVSMDLITVDVTDVPDQIVQRGNFAELFGRMISIDEAANFAQTVGYEFLTNLGKRYPREYIDSMEQ